MGENQFYNNCMTVETEKERANVCMKAKIR